MIQFRGENIRSEGIDLEQFNKTVNGYFVLSFKYAQGSAPTQCLYNVLFVKWLQEQYPLEELKNISLGEYIQDVSVPKNHTIIDEVALRNGNKMARHSLDTTYNVLINNKQNNFKLFISDIDLKQSEDFTKYDPMEALEILEMDGEEGIYDQILWDTIIQDDKFVLSRRPNAKLTMATASYLRQYIIFADNPKTRHPFFDQLFLKEQDILKEGLSNREFGEDFERDIYALADLWENQNEGQERFFPQGFFDRSMKRAA